MTETIKPGYTRISDISGAFAGYGRIPQETLDKAAARGSLVHSLIFEFLNNVPISKEQWFYEGKPLNGYFDSFMKFWDGFKNPDIVLMEDRYYDDELMITGQPDMVIMMDGHPIILDWKCTSAVGRHWDIQAHGYAKLIATGYIDGRDYENYDCFTGQFIRLDKDGKNPDVQHYSLDTAYFRSMHYIFTKYFKDLKCNLEME